MVVCSNLARIRSHASGVDVPDKALLDRLDTPQQVQTKSEVGKVMTAPIRARPTYGRTVAEKSWHSARSET